MENIVIIVNGQEIVMEEIPNHNNNELDNADRTWVSEDGDITVHKGHLDNVILVDNIKAPKTMDKGKIAKQMNTNLRFE